jgi:transcription-repair coupling factor (superfamily II helicase)
VAVLVPTTILADQHGRTFTERLADFPVKIEVLSRFRTSREQKQALERLSAGQIDIVIGTHRLLSPDVHFKDLGLLVVDEEHRFGVKHKERLKALRLMVDVLTLTATPIPRTLHLSLAGLRDLVLIETPPRSNSRANAAARCSWCTTGSRPSRPSPRGCGPWPRGPRLPWGTARWRARSSRRS